MVTKSLYEPYKAPIAIWWKVVAGNRNLSVLQDHDLILCDYDLKIRQIDPVTFHAKRKKPPHKFGEEE